MRVAWTEEEIRLLLSYYARMKSGDMHKGHPLVIEASREIRNLSINREYSNNDPKFRNPNGVALKLANFLFLDPNYFGKGMKGCSVLDKKIFKEFYMTDILDDVIEYNEAQYPFKFFNWFSSMSGGVRRPLDEDSGRPLGNVILEGQIHTLIQNMIDEYFQNKGKYICVLVGGPGNGKTDIMEYAAERFVEGLGEDWTEIKLELQDGFSKNNRQSIVSIKNQSLLLIQDASQRDIDADSYIDSIYNDFEKIESLDNGLSIICMNRGILETIRKESCDPYNKLSKYQEIIKSIYQFNTLDAALFDLKIWGAELEDSKKLYTWSMDFDTLFSKVKDQSLNQNFIYSVFEKAKCEENFCEDANALSPIFNASEFVANKLKKQNLSKILRSYEILNGKRFTYREVFSLIGYLFYYSEKELNLINKTNKELKNLNENQFFERFEKLYQLYQYTCNYRFFNQFVQPTSHLKVECKKAFKDEKAKNLDVLFSILSNDAKIKSALIPKFINDMESAFFDPILCSDNLVLKDDFGQDISLENITKNVIYNLELNIDNYSNTIPNIDRELINCLEKIKTEYCLQFTSDDVDVTRLNALDAFKSFLNTTIISFIKRGVFFSEYYIKDKLHIDKYLNIIEGNRAVKIQFVKEFSKAMKNGGTNIETSLVTSIGQTPNQFKTNISIETQPYPLYPLDPPKHILPSADQIILKYRVASTSTDKYIVITYKLYKEIMRSVERLLPSCLDQNFQLWKELKMSEISDKEYLYNADIIKIDSIGEIEIHSRNPELSYSLNRQINI